MIGIQPQICWNWRSFKKLVTYF